MSPDEIRDQMDQHEKIEQYLDSIITNAIHSYSDRLKKEGLPRPPSNHDDWKLGDYAGYGYEKDTVSILHDDTWGTRYTYDLPLKMLSLDTREEALDDKMAEIRAEMKARDDQKKKQKAAERKKLIAEGWTPPSK